MKILILAAMQKEIDLLLQMLENYEKDDIDALQVYHGEIGKHTVSVIKCGIGKVNSAINAYKLIRSLQPDLLINSGVAGGAGLPIGTVLIPEMVAYHDVWCGPGTKYGQADNMPLFFKTSPLVLNIIKKMPEKSGFNTGLLCSGDKFITSAEEILFIRRHFPDVKAIDMESASIAQVCVLTNTPFSIIRIVSDTPGDGENIAQYKDFWVKAPEKTFEALRHIINSLD